MGKRPYSVGIGDVEVTTQEAILVGLAQDALGDIVIVSGHVDGPYLLLRIRGEGFCFKSKVISVLCLGWCGQLERCV